MILVTVGNHVQPFDRLVKGMDKLAAQIDEEVVIQSGYATYEPRYARHFRFTSGKEMQELTRAARVQVCHAGSGSIISALRLGKPLVVVPRRVQYHEHIDDHQLQLADAVEKQGKLVAVPDPTPEALWQAIQKAASMDSPEGKTPPEMENLLGVISRYLDEWGVQIDKRRSGQRV
jgi:beta-1,4-N-acetylglucosaminyltransferase